MIHLLRFCAAAIAVSSAAFAGSEAARASILLTTNTAGTADLLVVPDIYDTGLVQTGGSTSISDGADTTKFQPRVDSVKAGVNYHILPGYEPLK